MATTYEIPITPRTPQALSVDLFGVTVSIRLTWQDAPEGGWIMDISDADGKPLVRGQPLVTGCDLLGQYAYLGIPGIMWVSTDGQPFAPPTFENLGVTSHLFVTG